MISTIKNVAREHAESLGFNFVFASPKELNQALDKKNLNVSTIVLDSFFSAGNTLTSGNLYDSRYELKFGCLRKTVSEDKDLTKCVEVIEPCEVDLFLFLNAFASDERLNADIGDFRTRSQYFASSQPTAGVTAEIKASTFCTQGLEPVP